MKRYTKAEIAEIKKGKNMSASDRETHFEMLADRFKRPITGIRQAYDRNKGRRTYSPRKPKEEAVMSPRITPAEGGVLEAPFTRYEVDFTRKIIRFHF